MFRHVSFTGTHGAESFGNRSRTRLPPFDAQALWLADHTSRWLTIVGIVLGITLMVWTWSRAASMSADGAHYMELAERSWRLGPGAGMDWYSGPGYPVIVGWIYALVGDLDFAGRLTSFVFGLATLAGVGILSYRMFGIPVAGIAAALLAVHTTFVRHTVMAETDAAYGCWLVWSILFVWELKHADSAWRQALWAMLAGVSLGCGYLTRPEAVPLTGLLGLWYLFGTGQTANADRSKRTAHGRRFPPVPFAPCPPFNRLPPKRIVTHPQWRLSRAGCSGPG